MQQLTIEDAIRQGETGMRRAESSADRRVPDFTKHVCAYFLALLATRGPLSGEDLTDAARAAGYCPADDRAFGAAFRLLLTSGARITGYAPRRKGHGSSGGKVYGLAL